jgi:hypothetical protein
MSCARSFPALFFLVLLVSQTAGPVAADSPEGQKVLMGVLNQLLPVVAPDKGKPGRAMSATVSLVSGPGIRKEITGLELQLAFQAPDRLRLGAVVDGKTYEAGRQGQHLWMARPDTGFGVMGKSGLPRFAAAPAELDDTKLPDFKLPVPRQQLILLPVLCSADLHDERVVDGAPCHNLLLTPRPEAEKFVKLPGLQIQLIVRKTDFLPLMIGWRLEKKEAFVVRIKEPKIEDARLASDWLPEGADQFEQVALGHLTRFVESALAALDQPKLKPLGEAAGARKVLARHGAGRLEEHDGTRVLFLKGTPEQMGAQHGALMKKDIAHLVSRILYGVGVGSSLPKGRWFFGEIEEAQARLQPFVSERHLAEMDAMADAAGVRREEMRLANFFPELFHCSGFALFGDATAGGRMFHGRILDYMKGAGLEQNAVVIVCQPDQGHAWVNVGYAGFTGTVTAMNERQIAIGEMGGRGEGNWDGKPMAQLMREVMEQASTIDEAVEIMRRGPRTCEYYYVISDAKSMRAVGIAATPDKFETVWAGESHPLLPHAVKDSVLLSAGDRYETLVQRVRDGFGGFDDNRARDLMTRPVCMNSNIQSVLFAPDTLDFWVANADSENVASHTRYTRYNLGELLNSARQAAAD